MDALSFPEIPNEDESEVEILYIFYIERLTPDSCRMDSCQNLMLDFCSYKTIAEE
jgi:hypothetical protein